MSADAKTARRASDPEMAYPVNRPYPLPPGYCAYARKYHALGTQGIHASRCGRVVGGGLDEAAGVPVNQLSGLHVCASCWPPARPRR